VEDCEEVFSFCNFHQPGRIDIGTMADNVLLACRTQETAYKGLNDEKSSRSKIRPSN
jgi:hypothetical protein